MNGNDGDVGLGGLALGTTAGGTGIFMHHQANAMHTRIRLEAGASHGAFGLAAEVGAAPCAPRGCVGGAGVTATAGLHVRSLSELDGIVALNSGLST